MLKYLLLLQLESTTTVIPAEAGIQANTMIVKTSGYRTKSGMTKSDTFS
jgi:hypothetical protein